MHVQTSIKHRSGTGCKASPLVGYRTAMRFDCTNGRSEIALLCSNAPAGKCAESSSRQSSRMR